MCVCLPQAEEYGRTKADAVESQEERFAVVHFEWPIEMTEADPEHGETDEEMAVYHTIATHRRAPSDIPRNFIRKVVYYKGENEMSNPQIDPSDIGLDGQQLCQKYDAIADAQFGDGRWGDHPVFPHEAWRHEVNEDNTRLGYWEWVAAMIESATEAVPV
jgi:hypothetical protein